MSKPDAAWKFWSPMPLWQALGLFFAAQLLATFVVVALREGAGVAIPQWVAGGAGGLLGVIAVQALARKRRADSPPPSA